MPSLEDVKIALQRMAAEGSESQRKFARESLAHIEAGRVVCIPDPLAKVVQEEELELNASIEFRRLSVVELESGAVRWFVCKGCGRRAGWSGDGVSEPRGVVHVPPSCQLFRETPAGEFRRMHGG